MIKRKRPLLISTIVERSRAGSSDQLESGCQSVLFCREAGGEFRPPGTQNRKIAPAVRVLTSASPVSSSSPTSLKSV
jgi:hypothetical protein